MRKRILVIDDDPELVEVIEAALKEHKYEVFTAKDGLRGIETTNRQAVDLIILDLRMPLFSGFWVCNAFLERAKTRDVPILIISGLSKKEEIEKAYRLGARAYLKKPFHVQELVETVEKTIS
jgi:DNA-binding response OmpR family regulator